MKKVVSLLLALCLIFALAACGSDNTPAKESASPAGSTEPSASDPATTDSATPAESETPATSSDPVAAGHVGYWDDDVDHSARKTYQFFYLYKDALTLNETHFTAMKNLEKKLNFTVESISSTNDQDKFLNNIEVCAVQGCDGLIIEPDPEISLRIKEVCDENNVNYVYTINDLSDDNGHNLVPVVVLDQYKNGQTQIQWLQDNYKNYWDNDIDTSKFALMSLELSSNPALITRANGVKDKFAELYPDVPVYIGDLVTTGYGMSYAYDQCAAILAAHPEVEYWWIAGTVEDFSQGAARCVEEKKLDDKILIVSSGANVLPLEWDAGYNGCWVASYAVFNYNYIVPALCGLIALCDGRATHETLWADQRAEGDICTRYIAGDQMVTVDTYKGVQDEIAKMYGVEGA